jgi:CRISPR-associated protein Csd1
LGLAPNAARIVVRFWQEGPVRDFASHIARHFRDIEIVAPGFEKPYLPLYRLLNSTALQNKGENVPPDMAGDTMRAILTGRPYPAMLLQAAVRRCRAERQVNYPRAAIIKACLNRLSAKELTMSLDLDNTDPGYRLGRLFSALERVQSAAQPGINATIRDRYYGAVSSSPASVFPVLLRLKNHHLAKLDGGLATWYEKLFGEIVAGITAFPPQLSLKEQGLFAIGYYHQQQDFFTGKSKLVSTPDSNAGEN